MKEIITIYAGIMGLTLLIVKALNLIFHFGLALLWLYAVAFVVATLTVIGSRKRRVE